MQHYAQIRFPLHKKGDYADYCCKLTAADLVDASRLFAAFRLGFHIATNLQVGCHTITNIPPTASEEQSAKTFDLTSDQDRKELIDNLERLRKA